MVGEPGPPTTGRKLYLKWLPAPMKYSMGIESRKFARGTSKAVVPISSLQEGSLKAFLHMVELSKVRIS